MTTTDPSNRSRVAAIVAERRRDLGEAPSVDTLRAYLAGELSPEEADRVQEHLATDPDLADLLLDLHDFERAEPETPSLSTDELDERLARFHRAMDAGGSADDPTAPPHAAGPDDETPPAPAPVPDPASAVRPFRPPRRPARGGSGEPGASQARLWPAAAVLPIAALLLVGVGVAAWFAGQLATRTAQAAVVAELTPEGSFVTRSGDVPHIEVPPGLSQVVLVMPLLDTTADHASYRLEIAPADPEGATPLLSAPATPTDGDLFTQILPTEAVPPGSYRATLYGIGDDGRTSLATYRFDVVRTETGGSGHSEE